MRFDVNLSDGISWAELPQLMHNGLRIVGIGWTEAAAVIPNVLRIVGIVLGALLVRWLVFRGIRGFVTKAAAFDVHERLLSARLLLGEEARQLAERRRQRLETLGSALRSLASFSITVVALLMVLQQLGVHTAPVLASAGIVAAGIAFGSQALVRDFITGTFLIVEDQFGVGDSVDTGPVAGTIEAVGLRVTQIRDDAGVLWYVRNGEIVRVGNRTQGWANATVDVPVPIKADLDHVRAVLEPAALSLRTDPDWREDVLQDPAVTGPESMALDNVGMRVTVRTPPSEKLDVERELRGRIHSALKEHGYGIPEEPAEEEPGAVPAVPADPTAGTGPGA